MKTTKNMKNALSNTEIDADNSCMYPKLVKTSQDVIRSEILN